VNRAREIKKKLIKIKLKTFLTLLELLYNTRFMALRTFAKNEHNNKCRLTLVRMICFMALRMGKTKSKIFKNEKVKEVNNKTERLDRPSRLQNSGK